MKVMPALLALTSGALVLGAIAPTAGVAQESAGVARERAKPSGQALVRIDGGDARAIPRGDNLYRIVIPREAAILWLGEADRAMAIGTFGRKALVAAWPRLGHRQDGAHALTTITWEAPRDTRPPYVGARVGSLRINSDGLVTFLARTSEGLPSKLPGFSVNISRAERNTDVSGRKSGYPLNFPINAASGTVGVQATATGDTTASVSFITLSNGTRSGDCAKPAAQSLSSTNDYVTFFGTCGDTTWSAGSLSLWPGNGSNMASQLQIAATVVVKGGNPSSFPWNFNMGQWTTGGVQVWP